MRAIRFILNVVVYGGFLLPLMVTCMLINAGHKRK